MSRRRTPVPYAAVGLLALFAALLFGAGLRHVQARPLEQEIGGTIPAPLPGFAAYLPLIHRFDAVATVTSPDGAIVVRMGLSQLSGLVGVPRYSVVYGGRPVVVDSGLGLTTDDGQTRETEFEWLRTTARAVDESYVLPVAERSLIPNRFNEATIHLRQRERPERLMALIVRVYDEGVAFRYLLGRAVGSAQVTIQGENTQFIFAGDHDALYQNWTEDIYRSSPLSGIDGEVENPLTVTPADGFVFNVTEAAVDNYPRMFLDKLKDNPLGFFTGLGSLATVTLPFQTPWRVLMLGERPGDLLEHSYLMYNLAEPARFADATWIKPGTAMRIMYLTTQGALDVIDFAAQHGVEYVEFDAGWYGLGYFQEFNPESDATQPIAAIDMQRVIAHANSRGVGVVLYVNWVALQRQLDEIMPLYQSWGVKGVKFGYVDGHTQQGINFVHRAVEKAAQHQLIVDIHDNYRPSGLTRTYPNLLTQEGVRGNEHFTGAEHNTKVPFARLSIGAADYTVPYYSDLLNVTRAHQLAVSILFYSPLKFILWYDSPSNYGGEAEIELFGRLPTAWDETVTLDDALGDSAAIARRKGNDWYVGVITDETGRSLPIELSFLDKDMVYMAHIFADETPRSVEITTQEVDASTVLTATMLASGGQAIWLTPK
jgi:alpha-glucosidase